MSYFNPARLVLSLLLLSPAAEAADPQRFTSGTGRVSTIELFTSEGCSSCPPADAWLSRLKQDPRLWSGLVPMAFHVDYWDYIGWSDRFASPQYSDRQRTHQQQGNIRSVYTPGLLVNGREWRGWFRGGALPLAEEEAAELRVSIADTTVSATYPGVSEPLVFNVALLGFGLSNRVSRGENAGRELRHDFVVLQQGSQQSADGSWQLELPALHDTSDATRGLAAWVSRPHNLQPLQATGGWLTN